MPHASPVGSTAAGDVVTRCSMRATARTALLRRDVDVVYSYICVVMIYSNIE
jgi:hypothetical protein